VVMGTLSWCGSESQNLLPSYSHNYPKFVPTLYSTFAWFSLWDQSIMRLSRFLCFNGFCGFYVFSFLGDSIFKLMFQIDYIFQVPCLCHVPFKSLCFASGHVLKVWPCLRSWDMFLYQGHVLVSMFLYQVLVSIHVSIHVLVHCFLFRFYSFFLRYMFLCPYVSLFPSIQKTCIQKFHHLFAGYYVSYFQFLTCVTFSLVLFLLCLTFLACF